MGEGKEVFHKELKEAIKLWTKEALERVKDIEFSTFYAGCRAKEEELKKEGRMFLLSFLEEELKKRADAKEPEVFFLLDIKKRRVKVQINPLYICGRYRKYKRGIPQCRWDSYPTSVEEIICEPIKKACKASKTYFHGAGREDVDTLMLGRGRPFVCQVVHPYIRSVDLQKIEEEINKNDAVKVSELSFCKREYVRKIKMGNIKKEYHFKVLLQRKVKEEDIKNLEALCGIIVFQRTPMRVLHRRADKIRERKIFSINVSVVDEYMLDVNLKCEGGLYIKELVSGDGGNTVPSFSQVLQTPCICKELEVIDVDI